MLNLKAREDKLIEGLRYLVNDTHTHGMFDYEAVP